MKAKKEEESRMSKINSLNILNEWRRILRMAKADELKKNVEVLLQTHERQIDRKDSIIARLEKTLDEVEEQYQIALKSHRENIDNLISIHNQKINSLTDEFEHDLSELEDEFNGERFQNLYTQSIFTY
jgi:hypothetical protein